jgi:cell division protein FtsB
MWLEILLQFLTVFLGAFLAFWLENLRERRQLKTWVKKYLQRGYETMRQEQLQEEAEIPKLEQHNYHN